MTGPDQAPIEDSGEHAANHGLSWLAGKLATFEAWKQRPTRLAQVAENIQARTEERNQRSEAELQATIGRFHRFRAGEPEVVPASSEVMNMQFTDEQTPPPDASEQPEQ